MSGLEMTPLIDFHPIIIFIIGGTVGFICHFAYLVYVTISNSIFAEEIFGYTFAIAPAIAVGTSVFLLQDTSVLAIILAAIFSIPTYLLYLFIATIFALGTLDP